MAGQKQAQGVTLAIEAGFVVPGSSRLPFHRRGRTVIHGPEHIHDAGRFVAGILICSGDGVRQGGKQLRAVVETAFRPQLVQYPGTHHGFQGTTVDFFQVDTATEIKQVLELTAICPRRYDGIDGTFTQPLDGTQPIDDVALRVHGEAVATGIHIRRQYLQPHGFAFINEGHHLVGVLHIRRNGGGHEFRRVVNLEPGGLVGNQCIGGGVGFVEPVTRELFHQVEDLHGQVRVHALTFGPFFEDRPLLGHFFRLFLAHGPAQHVSAAQRVAGQLLGNLHHLLLIQDNPVGGFQDRLQPLVLVLRIRVGQRFATVLTVHEVINHAGFQRPRTIQGHQRDNVFEYIGLELFDQLLHALTFQLEHRRGIAPLEQVETGAVVQRNVVNNQIVQPFTAALHVGGFYGPINDGQGFQAEKVKLHQAGGFHIVLVVLRYQVGTVFFTVQRREVRQLARGDHHAPGVLAHVPGQAFQFEGHLHDFVGSVLVGIFIAFQEFTQGFFLLKRLGQRHARNARDHLGQAIGETVRLALYPRHVAHHRLGGHGAERNDLAHRITAVLVCHVVDHAVAFFHAEVDVKVGHGDPFRVKETFEQQVVANRIQVGNLHGIGHQGTGTGAPARAHRNFVVLAPLNKVGNDQEVTGEAHLVDDIQLEPQPVIVILSLYGVLGIILIQQHLETLFETVTGDFFKVLLDSHAVRNREIRQEVFPQANIQRTAASDLHRIFKRFGQVGKQLRHFFGGFQVLLFGVLLRTTRIVQGVAVVDTHPGFVSFEIFPAQKAYIVGCHHGQPQLPRQRNTGMQAIFVARARGTLHFQIETVAVHRGQPARILLRQLVLFCQ